MMYLKRKIYCQAVTVVLVLCVSLLLTGFAYGSRTTVDVWTVEDDLPQNTITSIAQTPDGYLWLGTQSGLARFNGFKFTVFNNENTPAFSVAFVQSLFVDSRGTLWIAMRGGGLIQYRDRRFNAYNMESGLLSNSVGAIAEVGDGEIWIGTENGINRIVDGKIHTIQLPANIPSKNIGAILEDRKNKIWIGAEEGGLYVIERKGDCFDVKSAGMEGYSVNVIYNDHLDNLWIGTRQSGLVKIKDGKRISLTTRSGLSGNDIICIHEDRKGDLWVGTYSGGISRIRGNKISIIDNRNGLSSNSVESLYQDAEGSMWIGTRAGGLNRLRDLKITTYTNEDGLSQDIVYGIYQDSKGAVWIATRGSGVNRFKDGRFTSISTKNGLSNDRVTSICEDARGNLWIGTYGGGINRLTNGKISVYTTNDGLSDNFVSAVYEDPDGILWVGTYRGGLNQLKDGKFVLYEDLRTRIYAIHKDRQGRLWVGTRGSGLMRIADGQTVTYTKSSGISSEYILTFYEDKDGALWIGTNGAGLARYKDDKFHVIAKKDGLPDNVIYRILEENDNFWMSSNRGIFKIERSALEDFIQGKRSQVKPVHYGKWDGMKSIECNGGIQPAGWKTSDGKLWFPTTAGVSVIDPADIKMNKFVPPVVIEDLFVDQKRCFLGESLEIPPGEGNLEIHYAGLSYFAPKKIYYKYKLNGFDKEWVDAGPRTVAYYTNLPPGSYSFTAIACNNDGYWNETGATIDVILKPYYYQTWWFYLFCALTAILIGFGIYKLRVKQLEQRHKDLEGLVEERTLQLAEANERLDLKVKRRTKELEKTNKQLIYAARVKTQFLANVSHELRTPLTSILGYSEMLRREDIEVDDKKRDNYLKIITEQGDNLLQLVKSLLDINAMESGTIKINLSLTKINEVIKRVHRQITPWLKNPDKELVLKLDKKVDACYLDNDKTTQIIQNLVTNAVKFSRGKRKIVIESKIRNGELCVSVSDKGVGISKELHNKIFDPFFQVDASSTRMYGGTGLGLYIVKSFLELHHGRIIVESERNMGTTFSIYLPMNLQPVDKAKALDKLGAKDVPAELLEEKIVLVIDDNEEMADLIKLMLKDNIRVYSANNGKDGVIKSLEVKPDMIFMDLAMPILNGYEATKIIKSKKETGNIPIIALSARTMPEEIEKAYQAGCVSHISKPFGIKQIQEVIEQYLA